ncbi:hypothetical protein CDH05_06885 [Pseudomonas lactis]|uniref:hypothetical protein n=1 Tax=Pseudomonas lactis TaxID=1615674 RepID=UPI000B653A6B|nr:hypothetical protein [Pseudomonas lactis]OWQ42532.1 hypothetical protein CDH05_06885 [Pseudomonas lactis]
MTQTMQEKFEAWHLARFPGASLSKRTNGEYINLYVGMCWIGWSASRETLVMDLPAVEAWDNDGRLDREKDDTADCAIGLVPVIDVRNALTELCIPFKATA